MSTHKRHLSKEPILNCTFRHFVVGSLSQKHIYPHFFSWICQNQWTWIDLNAGFWDQSSQVYKKWIQGNKAFMQWGPNPGNQADSHFHSLKQSLQLSHQSFCTEERCVSTKDKEQTEEVKSSAFGGRLSLTDQFNNQAADDKSYETEDGSPVTDSGPETQEYDYGTGTYTATQSCSQWRGWGVYAPLTDAHIKYKFQVSNNEVGVCRVNPWGCDVSKNRYS